MWWLDTVTAARRARLDLTGVQRDSQIGNGRILCFAGAVRDYRRPPSSMRHAHSCNRLAQGTDLIDFAQQRIAGYRLYGFSDAVDVGHQ